MTPAQLFAAIDAGDLATVARALAPAPAAPLCNLCGGALDDTHHVKVSVSGWHCRHQIRRGGRSQVTTAGADAFPARCDRWQHPTAAVSAICMRAHGHDGPHATQDGTVTWEGGR